MTGGLIKHSSVLQAAFFVLLFLQWSSLSNTLVHKISNLGHRDFEALLIKHSQNKIHKTTFILTRDLLEEVI